MNFKKTADTSFKDIFIKRPLEISIYFWLLQILKQPHIIQIYYSSNNNHNIYREIFNI